MSVITKLLNKFKIPTILGLGIIALGMVAGVLLNFREQIFLSQAAPDATPQNITISNVTDDSVTISWQTTQQATSFLTFGQSNPDHQTTLEDLDNTKPTPRFMHYVTAKNLLPKTNYQFKIVTGRKSSNVDKFDTAQPLTIQTTFGPVIGTVLNDNTPLKEGIAYLSIAGAITQSAPIKNSGNFLIPLSYIRKNDLSDIFPLTEDSVAKLTVMSERGTTNVLFKLKKESVILPPLILGQNIDLTTSKEAPKPTTIPESASSDLTRYDLNNDGKINSADNAIILQYFGKDPKNKKADINGDGKADQKDLDLMAKKLKELGAQ